MSGRQTGPAAGKMSCRRYISLLLLAVYLLATGGAAFRSLSCSCMDKGHVAEHLHAHCGHAAGVCDEAETLRATCACDRHSTEIELYTNPHSDDDKATRCAMVFLPAALAAECPCRPMCRRCGAKRLTGRIRSRIPLCWSRQDSGHLRYRLRTAKDGRAGGAVPSEEMF